MKISKPQLKISQVKAFFESADQSLKIYEKLLSENSKAAIWYLDRGEISVFENGAVNLWVKHAILNYFKSTNAEPMSSGVFEYSDKLPVKSKKSLNGVRVVPGAIARFGSFIEAGVILMPSFVNIGARVGSGTMVDTWATVGSCAQVGANVHLSGGVGIGGVLEPAQAAPVVIEDGVFVGSRAIIVEGVRIEKEAVIGAGVVITASSKIVDLRGSKPVITTGVVPKRAVVIPGSYPKKFPAGEFQVPCAFIIGSRKPSTDLKTSLNDALREHGVVV